MWNRLRNRFLYENSFIFEPVNRVPGSYNFECTVQEVDEFFNGEFRDYEKIKLCKTYELLLKKSTNANPNPIAFISYCNDSVKFEDTVKELVKIPEAQSRTYLPAIKIVWLGTSRELQSKGYGAHLINITKLLFISDENRTGCRLITVDARKDQRTLDFYLNNGFEYRSPKLTPEKKPNRNTYPMFFDLGSEWEYDPNVLQPILPDGTVYNIEDLQANTSSTHPS